MTAVSPIINSRDCATNPEHSQRPSIKQLATRGSAWMIFGYGGGQLLRLASNLVLTRMLFPEVFGMMALLNVFMQGLTMFSDIGIAPAIIHNKRGADAAFLDTAWTIQVIRGLALWVGSGLIAWPAAFIYGEPSLLLLLPVAGFGCAVSGLNSTAVPLANRSLEVGRLTLLSLLTQVLQIAVVLLIATLYKSVWAIVIGNLVSGIAYTSLTHTFLSRRRHRLRWDPEARSALFRFGRWIFVSTFITFIATQFDRLLLGWYLPLGKLGIYGLAIMLTALPRDIVSYLANGIIYPALAMHERSGSSFFGATVARTRRLILSAGAFTAVGLILGAPTFFRLFYDSRYHEAGWIAQIMAIATWISVLQMSADRALLTKGDTFSLLLSNVARFAIGAALCPIGYHLLALPGFLLGLVLSAIGGHVVIQWRLSRYNVWIISDDLYFTSVVACSSCVGLLIIRLAGASTTYLHGELTTVAVTSLVLLGLSLWMIRRVREQLDY
jgi:O-antigen/teichoic acid export membrane protein